MAFEKGHFEVVGRNHGTRELSLLLGFQIPDLLAEQVLRNSHDVVESDGALVI